VEILGKEYDKNEVINTMAKEKKIWYMFQKSNWQNKVGRVLWKRNDTGHNNPSGLIQNLWHFEFHLVLYTQTADDQVRGTEQ